MAETGRRWLIGCGIGCGGVILIGALLAGGGALWVRSLKHGYDEAVESRQALVEVHGEASDFVPPPDDWIPAARLDLFLAVRDSLAGPRRALAASFAALADGATRLEEDEGSWLDKLRLGLRVGGVGVDFARQLGELLRVRNAALLELGMSPGEYTWIYVLAYHSYLGHSPQDGAEDPDRSRRGPAPPGWLPGDPVQDRIRGDVLAMLGNLEEALAGRGGEAASAARGEVAAEIAALRADRRRVPFADGLPAPLRERLAARRSELEANYDRRVNALELGVMEKEGWSYRGR